MNPTMTLEQVRDELNVWRDMADDETPIRGEYRRLADAIDAHLATLAAERAEGGAVGYLPIGEGVGETSDFIVQWSPAFQDMGKGRYPLYLHPPANPPETASNAMNDVADRLEAIAPMLRAVPDGWKLVPVEPTEGMIDAWVLSDCGGLEPDISDDEANTRVATADWKAMLAASPDLSAGGGS